MIHWLWLIPAAMFGGLITTIIIALMIAAKCGDKT